MELNISKFNEDLIKSYNQEINKGFVFEIYIEHFWELHDLHSGLPFLPERMKINKCSKLVYNLCD